MLKLKGLILHKEVSFSSQVKKQKKQNLKTLQLSESSETLTYNYKARYLRHNMM